MAPITNVELLAIASKRWSQAVRANLTRLNEPKPASAAIHIRVPKLDLRLHEVNDPFNETDNPHKHSEEKKQNIRRQRSSSIGSRDSPTGSLHH